MNGSGHFERRESARLDMEKQIVSVTWEQDGKWVARDVMCFDVSRGGFQIEMEQPIPVGSLVKVLFLPHQPQCKTFEAKVLRITRCEHGWFNIGLQFISHKQPEE